MLGTRRTRTSADIPAVSGSRPVMLVTFDVPFEPEATRARRRRRRRVGAAPDHRQRGRGPARADLPRDEVRVRRHAGGRGRAARAGRARALPRGRGRAAPALQPAADRRAARARRRARARPARRRARPRALEAEDLREADEADPRAGGLPRLAARRRNRSRWIDRVAPAERDRDAQRHARATPARLPAIARASKREAGPCTPMIPASSPLLSRTGAAIAASPSSRSSRASANPRLRTCASSSTSRSRVVIVRGVNAVNGSAGSSTSPNASITLPTAVAWPTLGRPSWATLWTTEELCAKSTVTASCSPGGRERCRLTGLAHERLQVRPGERRGGRGARARRCRARSSRSDRRYRPVSGTCSTNRAEASVASRRETVLALIPVRRAISFVPSSPPSARASSTVNARSTAATWRTAG